MPIVTWRRRRLLYSSWLRATRWEFWPTWATYPPVVGHMLLLALEHRSVTVFTAANPAMPAGGVIGESKIDILRGLGPVGVARSMCIDAALSIERRLVMVDDFLACEGLDLPVVFKPNQGQRGTGVVVARTRQELEGLVERMRVDTIVQEFVSGLEFGIFYVRRPSDARGHILSITEKRLPFVIGDGVSTLEALILSDPETIGMARFHLRQHAARVSAVPAKGEVVSLGDCGSHCRGARFYDGHALLTPALERAVETMASRFQGFWFGRFDLRVPSVDALKRGEGLTVLELNGVTSEATHIYDPAVSLVEAYRALFTQWRLAFEIGAANAARGARVSSLAELAALVAGHAASRR